MFDEFLAFCDSKETDLPLDITDNPDEGVLQLQTQTAIRSTDQILPNFMSINDLLYFYMTEICSFEIHISCSTQKQYAL